MEKKDIKSDSLYNSENLDGNVAWSEDTWCFMCNDLPKFKSQMAVGDIASCSPVYCAELDCPEGISTFNPTDGTCRITTATGDCQVNDIAVFDENTLNMVRKNLNEKYCH